MPPGSPQPAPPRFWRLPRVIVLALLIAWLSLVFWNSAKPLPAGTHAVSQISRLSESDVDFLYESPQRQAVLAREKSAIDRAEQLVVLDRSPVPRELAQYLLARKRLRPLLKIVLVTDPGNVAFGGTAPQILTSLERAGIIVARVRLDRLRDSSPLYSGLWRMSFGWWTDPFEESTERITPAAWSRAQNFKADQRQLMVADDGSGGWITLIVPEAASSALVLRGSLARAIIASELQIAAWSTEDDRLPASPTMLGRGVGTIDARFLTEGAALTALLDALAAAGRDDRIDIAVDTFTERRIVAAALSAAQRGARLQVLLARHGAPNASVAGELLREGSGRVEVRWAAPETAGASLKLLAVRHRADLWVIAGSANLTRRNLDDLNLEAGVELRMPASSAPARAVADYFAKTWSGASARADAAETSAAAYWRYRFAEATGLSSF